jgi:hypothetical protein
MASSSTLFPDVADDDGLPAGDDDHRERLGLVAEERRLVAGQVGDVGFGGDHQRVDALGGEFASESGAACADVGGQCCAIHSCARAHSLSVHVS